MEPQNEIEKKRNIEPQRARRCGLGKANKQERDRERHSGNDKIGNNGRGFLHCGRNDRGGEWERGGEGK